MKQLSGKYGQYKEDVFNKLAFNFEGGKKLLDVGCGDGTDAEILVEEFGLDVYGIDVYEHGNLSNIKGLKFTRVENGVFNIPFENETFDYVFLHDVLHHVDEKNQSFDKHKTALLELKRVCKNGGSIIIVEGNRYNPLFYPHMVKVRKHEHFSQTYFNKLVVSVYPNAEFKYFEAHLYPKRLISCFKLYELVMEKYAPKRFLAYNVAIIENKSDTSNDKSTLFQKLSSVIRKVKLYGIKTSVGYMFNEIRYKYFYNNLLNSYSQEREDLFIDKYFEGKTNGFYVDVGAHDPVRFSNTKRFYDKGWCGINIEPDNNCYKKFILERPNDINLNFGIGPEKGEFTFYKMFPSTLSTFSEKEASDYEKQGYKIVEKLQVPMAPLSSVLEMYAENKKIDFYSIDTEGYDLDVLKSNDWKRFKPALICIESVAHTKSFEGEDRIGIGSYLAKKGYEKKFDNGINSIFILKERTV